MVAKVTKKNQSGKFFQIKMTPQSCEVILSIVNE